MLDQIEMRAAIFLPRTLSSPRAFAAAGCAPRRRGDGCRRGLFLLGLAMLVSGVAFKATMIGTFPVLSVVVSSDVGGVVFAITGPRLAGRGERPGPRLVHVSAAARLPADRSPAGWKIGSGAASRSRVRDGKGQPAGLPFFVPADADLADNARQDYPIRPT